MRRPIDTHLKPRFGVSPAKNHPDTVEYILKLRNRDTRVEPIGVFLLHPEFDPPIADAVICHSHDDADPVGDYVEIPAQKTLLLSVFATWPPKAHGTAQLLVTVKRNGMLDVVEQGHNAKLVLP